VVILGRLKVKMTQRPVTAKTVTQDENILIFERVT